MTAASCCTISGFSRTVDSCSAVVAASIHPTGRCEALEQRLRRSFESLFPAWADVEHTHFWRGLACLSHDLVPYVGPLDERKTVWTALAYHGNGVAMGSWCGGAVAHMIAGKPERANAPSVLTRRLSRFPLPGLRPAYLRGAYIWFEVADRLL